MKNLAPHWTRHASRHILLCEFRPQVPGQLHGQSQQADSVHPWIHPTSSPRSRPWIPFWTHPWIHSWIHPDPPLGSLLDEEELDAVEVCACADAGQVGGEELLDELTETLAPPGVARLDGVRHAAEYELQRERRRHHDAEAHRQRLLWGGGRQE